MGAAGSNLRVLEEGGEAALSLALRRRLPTLKHKEGGRKTGWTLVLLAKTESLQCQPGATQGEDL